MKPFAKRLLNVFAALLNIIAVLGVLFTAITIVGYVRSITTGWSWVAEELIARLSVGVLPVLFVCTVNYLVFGKFRVWNRIMVSSSQRDQV